MGHPIWQQQETRNLLVPRTENHLSSFKCGFMNIFSRQNLLRNLSRLLFLLRWNIYGAKKCLKNHIPFDFWDDSTLGSRKNDRKAFEGASMELTKCMAWTGKETLTGLNIGKHSPENNQSDLRDVVFHMVM